MDLKFNIFNKKLWYDDQTVFKFSLNKRTVQSLDHHSPLHSDHG